MFLIDREGHAAPFSTRAIELLQSPHFTTELGLFQLECNLDPQVLEGSAL